ncbi:MAG: hemerythrin domain-containing protein [Propionivibrio sp.]|uniref:Hemerythrin domain-containing protein n=1 Tax=Candidatus Propionivibrio dominans TaxID=2954373 RepID=A0A9D7IBG4_9RHOO|nr:hemerythrin domain-containing protein [Candidatus Propionivibrio dominans]
MKRHQKLQELSRQHHGALQLALKARRAALSEDQTQIKVLSAACFAAFYAQLDPHFAVEENTLLHILRTASEDKLVARLECDHKELRRLSVQLQQPAAMTLLSFAELLASHVRFEEREMFVVLEALLDGK